MLKISIPKPCYEDWDAMTPGNQGRHCSVCAKTVVDFTSMSNEEVQAYFINRKTGSTCGRFRGDQLASVTISLPQNIFETKIAHWKKFLAACLLAFSTMLFSCNTQIDKPADKEALNNNKINNYEKDTIPKSSGYVGGIVFKLDTTYIQKQEECSVTFGVPMYNDTTYQEKKDSIKPKENITEFMGDTILVQTPDSANKNQSTVKEEIIKRDSSCNNEGFINL